MSRSSPLYRISQEKLSRKDPSSSCPKSSEELEKAPCKTQGTCETIEIFGSSYENSSRKKERGSINYTITCASISIRIFSMTFRSFHLIGHDCVTWTDSAPLPATRRISPSRSMISAVRIASSRDGIIQKFSHSFRSIPSDTSRIIENESSVYVSSSVRIITSEAR